MSIRHQPNNKINKKTFRDKHTVILIVKLTLQQLDIFNDGGM